jgi:hypothetical protein
VRDALREFERRMSERNTAFVRHLRPGLSDAQIDALTGGLPFRVSAELRAFYNWHDGVTEHPRPEWPYFPGGGILTPLGIAVEEYHEWASDPPVPGRVYQPTWFPINSMDGIAIVLDCDVPDGAASPVHIVDHKAEWRYHRVPSLLHAVQLWNQMLDEGYWVYDESEGEWEDHFSDIPVELQVTGLV